MEVFSDWIISESTSAETYNVVFRNRDSICPAGIRGAFDRNQTFDESFFIDCLDDQPTRICCDAVVVKADGKIRSIQG